MRFWPVAVLFSTSPAITPVLGRETCLKLTSRLLVGVLVPVLCVSTVGAQDAATGVVIGRVTDASGAPVAGARVVATRTATAVVRETATDSAGRYALASLAPGEYRISIEMPGFAPKTLERVVVEVGRRVPADAVLDVSGGAEAVTVEERVIPVATGGSLVGGVVSSGVVESLPLNGRNFLELAFLFPGNAPAPNFDPTKSNTLALSSAGQLGRGGNITIDGQDNNDDVVGGPLANLPQDAVQEFQMATNRFSAEQGRSAASAVNVVTRSGTDTFSGTATFLYRDDALQGLPATFDRSSGPAPRSPASSLGDARRADRTRQGLVVRGRRVPEPGRRRPGRRARRRDAHDPAGAGPGAAHRLPRPGARRRACLGERHAQPALRGGRPEQHCGQHARPLDRLLLAAPGQQQQAPAGPRHLDAHAGPDLRQHPARELQRLSQLDRARGAGPPAHLPERAGRGELPRAAGRRRSAGR